MGLRDWVKKRARDAKRKAEQLKRQAERAANDAKRIAEDAARQTEKLAREAAERTQRIAEQAAAEAERLAREAAAEAERLAKEVEEQTRGEIMSIIDDIKKLAGKAEREVKSVVETAKTEIESTANRAKNDIQGAANTVKNEVEALPDKAKKEIEDAFSAIVNGFMAAGLKKVQEAMNVTHTQMTVLRENRPGLVEAIDALGIYFEFGPIKANYSNFYKRFDDLSLSLSRPPELTRSSIIRWLALTGPDSIDFGISVQVVALVVGSKELGVGGGFGDIPLALALELLDLILEAAGVPE